jgi:hypothetical protein
VLHVLLLPTAGTNISVFFCIQSLQAEEAPAACHDSQCLLVLRFSQQQEHMPLGREGGGGGKGFCHDHRLSKSDVLTCNAVLYDIAEQCQCMAGMVLCWALLPSPLAVCGCPGRTPITWLWMEWSSTTHQCQVGLSLGHSAVGLPSFLALQPNMAGFGPHAGLENARDGADCLWWSW